MTTTTLDIPGEARICLGCNLFHQPREYPVNCREGHTACTLDQHLVCAKGSPRG